MAGLKISSTQTFKDRQQYQNSCLTQAYLMQKQKKRDYSISPSMMSSSDYIPSLGVKNKHDFSLQGKYITKTQAQKNLNDFHRKNI